MHISKLAQRLGKSKRGIRERKGAERRIFWSDPNSESTQQGPGVGSIARNGSGPVKRVLQGDCQEAVMVKRQSWLRESHE